jgi:hypothetical protein
MEYSKNGSTYTSAGTVTVSSGSQASFTLNDVDPATYYLRATVTDPVGESALETYNYTVNPQQIVSIIVDPNPIKAGLWVTLTVQTVGYADQCFVTLRGGHNNGLVISLVNENPTTNLTNIWKGQYQIYKFEPDGNIPFDVESRRGVRADTDSGNIVVSGSYLEDTVPSVKE